MATPSDIALAGGCRARPARGESGRAGVRVFKPLRQIIEATLGAVLTLR